MEFVDVGSLSVAPVQRAPEPPTGSLEKDVRKRRQAELAVEAHLVDQYRRRWPVLSSKLRHQASCSLSAQAFPFGLYAAGETKLSASSPPARSDSGRIARSSSRCLQSNVQVTYANLQIIAE